MRQQTIQSLKVKFRFDEAPKRLWYPITQKKSMIQVQVSLETVIVVKNQTSKSLGHVFKNFSCGCFWRPFQWPRMVILQEEYRREKPNSRDTWGTPEACCVLLSHVVTFFDVDSLHDGGTNGQGNADTDLVGGINLQATLSFIYWRYPSFGMKLPCHHIGSLHS